MLRKQINKLGLGSALLITVLSFGAFAGSLAVFTNNKFGFEPTTLADDGEDGGDNESGDDNEDENKDEEDDNNDDEERSQERVKKEQEKEREKAKKQAERVRENSDRENDNEDSDEAEDGDARDDADEIDDDSDEDEGDNNGMFKDRDKTLAKLQEKIAEAEKKILEKQAEGADVTAALNRLALAKSALTLVGYAFDAGNLEEAKRLAKETRKLEHFARDNDLHDARKIAESIRKVAKRIAQVEEKLTKLQALGGDTSSFEATLAEAKKMFDDAKALIGSGGMDVISGFAQLETTERRVKNIKHAVENAIFALGGEDDDFDDDHRSEVAEFVKGLNEVADIEEGGIGKRVRIVARAQQLSADKTASLINDVKGRSALVRFLVGPKSDDLDEIQEEIAANNARVTILNKVIAQIDDVDIKAMLSEQVAVLEQETTNLTAFVNGELDKSTLLAWFSAFVPKF
jgi:hypothetical protein